MPLKADVQGMVHKYPESFKIGREQVRQFARSIKADDPATHLADVLASGW